MPLQKIDVVTTALRRAEILDLAFKSYFAGGITNLPPVRLIINVDPIGDSSVEEIYKLAKKYSSDILIRAPEQGCFSDAVNWAWSQVKTEYFLHLEDDWLLRRPVDFLEWSSALENSGDLQSVLIRKKRRQIVDCGGSAGLHFSFRANLSRRDVIQRVGDIPQGFNPEKYAIQRLGSQSVSNDFGDEYQLIDMGRKWSKSRGWRKADKNNQITADSLSASSNWFGERSSNFLNTIDYLRSRLHWRIILNSYSTHVT